MSDPDVTALSQNFDQDPFSAERLEETPIKEDALVRGRIRRGSVALVCALIGVAANAGDAHAYENWYCGVLLNSGSWCGDGSNHSYDYNRGNYNGSGSTWVCARFLYADTSTQRGGSGCGWNEGVLSIGSNTTLLEAEVRHQDGSARHTIYGYAFT